MPIDRQELSRKLARAIALKQVGKNDEAHAEAVALVGLLRDAGILRTDHAHPSESADVTGVRRARPHDATR